jgi:hypothetical protein
MEKLNQQVQPSIHTLRHGLQNDKLYIWMLLLHIDKQLMQTNKIPTGKCIVALGINKALVLCMYIILTFSLHVVWTGLAHYSQHCSHMSYLVPSHFLSVLPSILLVHLLRMNIFGTHFICNTSKLIDIIYSHHKN